MNVTLLFIKTVFCFCFCCCCFFFVVVVLLLFLLLLLFCCVLFGEGGLKSIYIGATCLYMLLALQF